MRVLLTAVNARFSHTNLAVRDLRNVLTGAGVPCEIAEYTINQPAREILTDLARRRPDVLLFSCYLWNIELIRRVGADFRLLFPEAVIVLGGPEVSFDAEEQLAAMPWADAVIAGEGETVIAGLLRERRPAGVYRPSGFVELDSLPFPYDDPGALQNRVLYYESSRGCPYGCSYCLSSADRTTRFRSLDLVYADLQRFLDAGAMRVKFVDRTFNLDGERALAVWRYLGAHDNGVTCFQMELGGDLLTGEQTDFLRTLRPGLLQFEIGVQSTCEATLEEVCRKTDLDRLKRNVRAVKAGGNIHQHLDLIAGLPREGFARFARSFDEVFALRPEQLQLGFLKLLRGSALYAKRGAYGLVHSELPPYEVLRTPALSFAELARLKLVEETVEVYYNSGRFTHLLEYLLTLSESPFDAFLRLGEELPPQKIGKYEYYDLLFRRCVAAGGDPEPARWLAKYDLCLHERPRKLPECCAQAVGRRPEGAEKLAKTMYAEAFPYAVDEAGHPPGETALCFDYARRDLLGRAHCERLG